MSPAIFALWFQLAGAAAPASTDAWRIAHDAQSAVESGTDVRFEQEWRRALARNASDRRALLAIATLERLRYRYAQADSLYERVVQLDPTGSQYAAAANLGMAAWRALGRDVARADSLFTHARAQAAAAGDRRIEAQALTGLGQVRARRVGPKAGLELVREARTVLDRPTPEDSAQLDCLEGSFQEQLGDSTGRWLVFHGRDVAKRAGQRRVWGACDVFIAQTVERVGAFDQAARTAAEAVRLFEQVHYLIGVANASQWLGYVRGKRGYFTEAQADLDRAIRAAEITHFGTVEAWARVDLAELHLALGDRGAARAEAARAAELHAAYGDLWGLAVDRRFEGLVLASQGRWDDACTKFTAAVAAYRRAGLDFNAVDPLRLLADASMTAGRLDSAAHTLDEATRLAHASGNPGWSGELPRQLARLAMLRGDYGLADSLATIVRARNPWTDESLLSIVAAAQEAQLALRERRFAVAESAVTFMSSAIATWRRRIADKDLRAGLAQLRTDWGPLSDAYPDIVARLSTAGHVASAFRFVESIRAREIAEGMLRAVAGMNDSTAALGALRRIAISSRPESIDEVRRRLTSDEALAVMTLGIGGAPTTAIVVTRDTVRAVELASRETLAPLIDRYLRVAATGMEPARVGRELGAALLEPIARLLPPRITHLAISPDGELYRVPFDALRLADDHFAVERYAISVVPSATVAGMLASLSPATRARRLVAIGDPLFATREAASAPANDTRFAGLRLSRLPRSGDEARRVAEYGVESTVLTREQASGAAVRHIDWRTVGVAHFATHALVDDEGQSLTALAVSPTRGDDGFLTTAQLSSLQLDGALIVLSACQSLGGQILGGEGLRGLAAPLLEAGARAVVVTHWSIGDRSVLPFVDRFYAAMARGASVGDALRETKLAAIHDGARIADWAAFTVIGDASMHPFLRPRRLSPLEWLHDLVQPARDTSVTR